MYAPKSWESGDEQDQMCRCLTFERHTFKCMCTDRCGPIKPWWFGLDVALSIIQTIVDAVLTKDECIQWATSAYIDNMYITESVIPVGHVKKHLDSFSLKSKEPEGLKDGVSALGLQVWSSITHYTGEKGTRSQLCLMLSLNAMYFHYVASWLGTFLWVDGFVWLWTSSSRERLRLLLVGTTKLMMPLSTTTSRRFSLECTRKVWHVANCVDGQNSVWVDGSSLATSVSLEYSGTVVEDTWWLWPEKDS